MTTQELIAMVEEFQVQEVEMLKSKGADYSGTSDTLSNFKSIAALSGTSKYFVWLVYFLKHVWAINTWVKTGGNLKDESIESRIMDARNYLILLLALIKEDAEL